mmetsp:Transcript_26858/g.61940  ORF Transcript_26858/g.61940 Transcript_26858/m.61940 type:complete len:194 (-) Transcript_26858:58-639(-)
MPPTVSWRPSLVEMYDSAASVPRSRSLPRVNQAPADNAPDSPYLRKAAKLAEIHKTRPTRTASGASLHGPWWAEPPVSSSIGHFGPDPKVPGAKYVHNKYLDTLSLLQPLRPSTSEEAQRNQEYDVPQSYITMANVQHVALVPIQVAASRQSSRGLKRIGGKVLPAGLSNNESLMVRPFGGFPMDLKSRVGSP